MNEEAKTSKGAISGLGRRLADTYVTWKHVVVALPFMAAAFGPIFIWVLSEARHAADPAMAVAVATSAKVDSAVNSVRTDDALEHQRIEMTHKELGEKIDHLTDLLLTGQVRVNAGATIHAGGHR